jgi:hypothetical protein
MGAVQGSAVGGSATSAASTVPLNLSSNTGAHTANGNKNIHFILKYSYDGHKLGSNLLWQ